jgi:hypothetical protein
MKSVCTLYVENKQLTYLNWRLSLLLFAFIPKSNLFCITGDVKKGTDVYTRIFSVLRAKHIRILISCGVSRWPI